MLAFIRSLAIVSFLGLVMTPIEAMAFPGGR